jgi:1,2-diacylglycerol 3-beta-galactosyltransferase
MSDTGGGHRAAAEAIQAAADVRFPGALEFDLVDVFRYYTPPPFKFAPEIYPRWVNSVPRTWHLGYWLTNKRRLSKWMVNFFGMYWRHGIKRLLAEHPADLVLAVHSIVSRPVIKALHENDIRPPIVTVVTDLVSTHAFWFDPLVDRCLLPTQSAAESALHFGLSSEQIRVTGLPVHPKFMDGLVSQQQARAQLGLDVELPTVLLVSGGEGMGPVFTIAEAINARGLDCQLLIIAGRNESLRQHLQDHTWKQPTTIYGFVDNMPILMAAADFLVTKAGPATITEACIAGLPIILCGAVPGQEAGNIDLVVENDAGVYAPQPEQVAECVADWLSQNRDELRRRGERAKTLARPQAVWDIVEEVHDMAQRPPIPVTRAQPIRESLRELLSRPSANR